MARRASCWYFPEMLLTSRWRSQPC
jgi:hypothetical protein